MNGSRFYTHLAMAWLTAGGCYLAYLYRPRAEAGSILTIGLAYISLLQIVITLAIGPLKLFIQRRNPVNIMLRRDIGIWAGITGLLHVFFGLQLHQGGDILSFFFHSDGTVMWNLFGQANYLGLAATVVLVLLTVLSNDLSLRKFKGRTWKWLQRTNYLLTPLTFLHALWYQDVARRDPAFIYAVYVLIGFTVVIQAVGIYRYRAQRQRRLNP
ncbi:MAG: ferric reductase-like transmembrane domain-containing protein [Anaerolineae bacterium]